MDIKRLEEIAERLAGALPPGLKDLRGELEDNFRTILKNNLDRLDLISRERFEAQSRLLERSAERLAELEKRLAELEARKPR